jgi:hypothetical protein
LAQPIASPNFLAADMEIADGVRAIVRAYVQEFQGAGAWLAPVPVAGIPESAAPSNSNFLAGAQPLGHGTSNAFFLRLADARHGEDLLRRLRDDSSGSILTAENPPRFEAAAIQTSAGKGVERDWFIKKCQLREAEKLLATSNPRADIAVVDIGLLGFEHPELRGVVRNPPRTVGPGDAAHAAAVSAVIAASRSDGPGHGGFAGMEGCCTATIRHFDVEAKAGSNKGGIDFIALQSALTRIANNGIAVANLAFTATEIDDLTRNAICAAVSRGVTLVASMGNEGERNLPRFPAAVPSVIAVGATDRNDIPMPQSCIGKHICLCAPGDAIYTVSGDDAYGWYSGTSFSAAIVSSAVWLARRFAPGLSPDDIRTMLKETVEPKTKPAGGFSNEIGCGRINAAEFAQKVLKSA